VRLQAFPSASATLVPSALALLAARHPGLEPVTTEALPPQAEQAVRSRDCDTAVVSTYDDDGRTSYADLHVVPLLVEPVYAVVPHGSRLARRRTITLDLLAEQTWIAGCEMCRGHLVRSAAAAGFAPDIRHATDDYLVAQGLVAAGLGVTLLPARALNSRAPPACGGGSRRRSALPGVRDRPAGDGGGPGRGRPAGGAGGGARTG